MRFSISPSADRLASFICSRRAAIFASISCFDCSALGPGFAWIRVCLRGRLLHLGLGLGSRLCQLPKRYPVANGGRSTTGPETTPVNARGRRSGGSPRSSAARPAPIHHRPPKETRSEIASRAARSSQRRRCRKLDGETRGRGIGGCVAHIVVRWRTSVCADARRRGRTARGAVHAASYSGDTSMW